MAQDQSSTVNLSDAGQNGTNGLYGRAKETAGKVFEAVSERAAETVDEQVNVVSEGLSEIAEGLRHTGAELNGLTADNTIASAAAHYSSAAADTLANIGDYFRRKDPREMLLDAEMLAKRNPALFVGGALGLGFLAARFLKSAPRRDLEAAAGRTFRAAASPASTEEGVTPDGRGIWRPGR